MLKLEYAPLNEYFCFLLYSRDDVSMVTKLVLQINALFNKNEKSYVN